MKIKLIAVGKLKESYLREGVAEYAKRLGTDLQQVELADERIPERPSAREIGTVKNKEGDRILASLGPKDKIIALTLDGKLLTSEALAAQLSDWAIYGAEAASFVIGGSLGLSEAVVARADLKLSFGRMTLPHQLMRLVLAEQIYRAMMINRGSTYHK